MLLNDEVTIVPRQRTWPAILSLYILAPLIAETIASFNTPPLAYLSIFNAVFIPAFYGSAALLIHDILVRRRLGWISFLILAAAFGIVNEAVIAGTWYTVSPTGYTFINGIDWGWAAALTAYHIVFSMGVPIALIGAMYPAIAQQPYLGKQGFRSFGMLFLLTTLLGLSIPAYHHQRFFFWVVAIVITSIAMVLPPRTVRLADVTPAPPLGRLRWLGAGGTIGFFVIIYLLPALLFPHPFVMVACMVAVIAAATIRYCTWQRHAGWQASHIVALLTGVAATDFVLAFLQWQTGAPIVVALSLLGLIWLARRLQRQTAPPLSTVPTAIVTEY